MFVGTPIWDGAVTDLGIAFRNVGGGWRGTGGVESEWLDALRNRALSSGDQTLVHQTQTMLALIRDSNRDKAAGQGFGALFEAAREAAYPASTLLLRELQGVNSVSQDHTLNCIDRGMIRRLEDQAVTDPTARRLQQSLVGRLQKSVRNRAASEMQSLFEDYGEALAFLLLKDRGGQKLTITKRTGPGPDFECRLEQPSAATLTFYVEVKSLDILNPTQRLRQMQEDALDAQIEIERQIAGGARVGSAVTVVAPYRKSDEDPAYDPRSNRMVVERLSEKLASNFSRAQFGLGPTFALANLLRLGILPQGPATLKPDFVDADTGQPVTGILWSIAYGRRGTHVRRPPEFSGARCDDGVLARDGLLVDPALQIPAAALLFLLEEDNAYRLAGLTAPTPTPGQGWTARDTAVVLSLLCDAWNDRPDSRPIPGHWT